MENVLVSSVSMSNSNLIPIILNNIPYQQYFRKKKFDQQFSKFLEIFKKLNINIPFAYALEKMPNYIKFMKDMLSKKKKFKKYETVSLTEECSVIFQKNCLKS